MILRRLGTAIRKQDWFVVILEIFIVVFGVFIGLQVDDWNQERQDRKQEKIILERLLEEAEDAVVHLSGYVENRARQNEDRERLIAFVSDPDQYPMDEAEAAATLLSLNHYPAMTPPNSVLEEMKTSGYLQLIQSREVRDAIGEYVSSMDFLESQLVQFRQGSFANSEAPVPYIRSEYAPGERGLRRNTVDWNGLRKDQVVIFYVIESLRNQIVFQNYREWVLREAQRMCEALAGELRRECQPQLTREQNGGGS